MCMQDIEPWDSKTVSEKCPEVGMQEVGGKVFQIIEKLWSYINRFINSPPKTLRNPAPLQDMIQYQYVGH